MRFSTQQQLGAVHLRMARRPASLGYRLLVCDANTRAEHSVVECGARVLPTTKAIASEARLVFTCLPSLEALREVALGVDGLCAGSAIESYVDFSATGLTLAAPGA